MAEDITHERERLREARESGTPWRKWGPYLSERQWGTVREDYSETGDAWNYFTHDQSRSRAYRWGEDGIAGVSDDMQLLCFALALWNGKDPILKERIFGLTNSEGNHGEDAKEYYFYVDSTPTHSYMKYLYKYPQAAFPYDNLVQTNRLRGRYDLEYELLDTGVFNQDRYFDVFIEYAKESPEDILIKISVANRGPESASLQLLPTLWFRNTWQLDPQVPVPALKQVDGPSGASVVAAAHPTLGERYLYCDGAAPLLFTDNETNTMKLLGVPNRTPYVKDGINNYVVNGKQDAVNPGKSGTKAAAQYHLTVGPGATETIRLRLTMARPEDGQPFGPHFEEVFSARQHEADEFYADITPDSCTPDQANVLRQAMAGMLWSKQAYIYDVDQWLDQHGTATGRSRQGVRNGQWFHMINEDVISMPDKWEYPWYAAWDLAFHTIALTTVDPDFANQQLELMLRERYLHPNGQLPAYEWNFSDVNPPVHAWATLFNYRNARSLNPEADLEFLKRAFQKLVLNFTWWVNRKDRNGANVFEGGFLGLDNIGVFDRSAPLPMGGFLEQADGTAWMALFSQNMLEMAIELAMHDSSYEDMASKFYEHFLWIAGAMDRMGDNEDEMWDEEDGFFYDVLRLPDGNARRLKLRTMVGLLPLCAATVYPEEALTKLTRFVASGTEFTQHHPELIANINRPGKAGAGGRRLLSLLTEPKLRRVLSRMLDENEFFGPYGIRSVSRYHLDHPFEMDMGGEHYTVKYLPAESDSGMFGGNSNWRGPVWMPVNVLILRALLQLYSFYGNDFTIECPTGSGRQMNLYQVSEELARRLEAIFLRNDQGRRPVYGGTEKFQTDPYWKDYLQFYEYFHGDIGAGLGASHQTGWTGLVGALIRLYGMTSADDLLKTGRIPLTRRSRAAAHQAAAHQAKEG